MQYCDGSIWISAGHIRRKRRREDRRRKPRRRQKRLKGLQIR